MPKPLPEPVVTGLEQHPAVQAWRRFDWNFREPVAVTALKAQSKPGHKSGVYRLHAAGPGGANVIVKRCRSQSAQRERTVYEVILPRLGIPALQYHGMLEEEDGENSWLFLEDAGEERCRDDERVGLILWLGTLHTQAVDVVGGSDLAVRGSERYLRHLREGRERIDNSQGAAHLTPEELDVLRRILALCDLLEQRWPDMEPLVTRFPPTLVHGDLSSKNVRVRRSASGLAFFALDWETAGVGIPAADLGSLSQDVEDVNDLPLEAYLSHVAPQWGCSRSELQQLADVGVVYRMAASIDWATYSLRYPPGRKPIRYLKSFERRLLTVLPRLGWS